MPTSSQSKILSVIDYQLVQQQPNGQDGIAKPTVYNASTRVPRNEPKRRAQKDDYSILNENKNGEDNRSPSPLNINSRRTSIAKSSDGKFSTSKFVFRLLFILPKIKVVNILIFFQQD